MANFINELIRSNRQKAFRPLPYKELKPEWRANFIRWGEGLYYSNIQSKNNNLVAKLISKYSKGLTHTIAILYSENLRAWFTAEDWAKVVESWNFFYGNTKELDNTVKILVLASANEAKIAVCAFSHYQKRKLSIRNPKVPTLKAGSIITYFVSRLRKPYDYTGLGGWLLYKTCEFLGFLDDPEADFCSEIVYDGFKKGDCLIANCDNPSPVNIEDYERGRIVYTDLTCLG